MSSPCFLKPLHHQMKGFFYTLYSNRNNPKFNLIKPLPEYKPGRGFVVFAKSSIDQ